MYPKTHHHRAQYPGWEQQEDQRRLCCAWETFSSLLTTCKPFSKEFLKIGSTLRTYLLNTINFLGFVKSKLGIIATESIPGKQPIARTVCATEGERKEPFRFILGLVPLQVKFKFPMFYSLQNILSFLPANLQGKENHHTGKYLPNCLCDVMSAGRGGGRRMWWVLGLDLS